MDAGVQVIKDSIYIGESSRTIYTRYQQHIRDYRRAQNQSSTTIADPAVTPTLDPMSSWMFDHSKEFHDVPSSSMENDYSFSVLGSYRDPMTRQINEAVRINRALDLGIHTTVRWKDVPITSLNRRGECFAPIERYDKQQQRNNYMIRN